MQTLYLVLFVCEMKNQSVELWRPSRQSSCPAERGNKPLVPSLAIPHLEVLAEETNTLCQYHVRVWILVAPE